MLSPWKLISVLLTDERARTFLVVTLYGQFWKLGPSNTQMSLYCTHYRDELFPSATSKVVRTVVVKNQLFVLILSLSVK